MDIRNISKDLSKKVAEPFNTIFSKGCYYRNQSHNKGVRRIETDAENAAGVAVGAI